MKNSNILVSSLWLTMLASTGSLLSATECSRIIKFSLCNGTVGCAWADGRCWEKGTLSLANDELGMMEFTETPFIENSGVSPNDSSAQLDYLGCTLDEHHCFRRSISSGFSDYVAEESELCPVEQNIGCWGSSPHLL